MKDKKSLLLILPILVFAGTFLVLKLLDNRSYAIYSDTAEVNAVIPEGTEYKMTRKNIYSWHLIKHNFNSAKSVNASGTKLLETKNQIGGQKYQAVAYCASEGKHLYQSHTRVRYSIDSAQVKSLDANQKAKLKAVMPYMYPYKPLGKTSADANTLKNVLKGSLGLGTDYDTYQFDNLNVNEAITAVQAAIWNIKEKKDADHGVSEIYYKYRTTISSFGSFNSCEEYHDNKIITSEEETWWNNGAGCDYRNKTGDFYKYVVNHTKDDNTENRINVLTNWYTNVLKGKLDAAGGGVVTPTITLTSSDFTSDGNLTVVYNSNVNFTIKITNAADGSVLLEQNGTSGSNTFTKNGIATSVKQVNISITAEPTSNGNVFYYKASSGQDFIGLERTYYTRNENLTLTRTEEKKGKIIIYKVANKNMNVTVDDNNNSSDFITSNCGAAATNCLSEARFQLYYGGKTYNHFVKELVLDYNNLATVMVDNLPLGTYYLKEVDPPYGYQVYNYNTAPVDENGFIEITLTDTGVAIPTKGVTVNNKSTKICIRKVSVNDTSKVLDGASFEIEDIDGTIYTDFTTSSQQGTICFEGQLPSASFFLKEKSAPNGYSIDPNRYYFSLGNTAGIEGLQDVTYKNAPKSGDTITLTNKEGLRMSKSDLTDGACVTGALLIIKNEAGQEVTRWTSTCKNPDGTGEEEHTVPICTTTEEQQAHAADGSTCLKPGKYTLTEQIHPEGYATAETIPFEIKSDGKVEGDTDMKDAPIEVCIYKVKKGTKEVLEGAEFEIYKKGEAEPYTKIVSSKEPCIPYFPIGEYVIKETKAPDGYALPENPETTIVVEDKAGHQDFYIENELIAPKTAMDYSITVVIIASVFMMFGIGLVGYYEYKKGH